MLCKCVFLGRWTYLKGTREGDRCQPMGLSYQYDKSGCNRADTYAITVNGAAGATRRSDLKPRHEKGIQSKPVYIDKWH
jgi:hypothetical protein